MPGDAVNPTLLPSPPTAPPSIGGRHLADAVATLLLTRLAGIGLAWVLEIALVRTLDPTSWQAMARFLTLVTVFSVAQLGLAESVLYFSARCPSSQQALRLTLRTSGLLGAIGALLALPFHASAELALHLLGSHGSGALLPLSLFVMSDLAFAPLPTFLLAQRRPRLASALSFGTRLAIALAVMAALGSGLGLQGALYAMALGSIGALLVGWFVVVKVTERDQAAPTERVGLREQLTFSLPVGLTRLVQIGNAKLDKYIVMGVFAEAVYGTYYLGAAELPIPAMLCGAATSVMMADFVRLAESPDRSRLLELWHRSIEKIALATLPLFVFSVLFAERLFTALYGEAHAEAAAQFRIFQLLLLARVTNFSSVSLALGQPRVPLVAAGLALALNALLSWLAVRSLGLSGPAIANVTSIYLSTLYTLWAIRRSLSVPWSRLLPLRSYLRTLGVALVAALPAAGVLSVGLPAGVTIVAGTLSYFLTYVALCRASAVMLAEDRAFLVGLLRLEFLRSPLPRTS